MNLRKILGALLALALLAAPAVAQPTSPTAVIGYFSTSGCPGTTPSGFACFIQYGSTVPVSGSLTPSGTQDTNLKQVNGATVNVGAGAAGTGTQRNSVAQDTTTIAGSAPGTAGTPSTNVVSVQGVSGGTAIPTSQSPGTRTLVTLDVKTVTTGGTAVDAISAGHRTEGGFLCNPQAATVNLGINEIGTAVGTTSSGDTTFIVPGQCYTVEPATTKVSVITSDSAHPFSGYGAQ